MRRKIIMLLVILATLFAGSLFVPASVFYYMRTGQWSRIDKIDTLQNPIAVTSWNAHGLILADGREIPIPGIESLPETSASLQVIVDRNVEVEPDGRVWGLVRIDRWCGNDPIRTQIVKVDLSDLLTFLRIGQPTAAVPYDDFLWVESGGHFDGYEGGWSVSEFSSFQMWLELKAEEI